MVNLQIKSDSPQQTTTLVDLLYERSQNQPHQPAYIFLQDGETETSRLTYQELAQQVRSLAAYLQSFCAVGDRALLVYQPSLDFVVGFLACLHAGIVAVPTYPPKRNQKLSRLQGIMRDAEAAVLLTHAAVSPLLAQGNQEDASFKSIPQIFTDQVEINFNDFTPVTVKPDTLAFLQYTSGSTGVPKGVMISHKNLIHNCTAIQHCLEDTSNMVGVTWLPPFHDMGLVGGVLQAVTSGITVVAIPPMAFLQNPLCWLKAISTYKAASSGGPNFAYDLCVQRMKPDQLTDLDLSSWEVAFAGAEPVRAETIASFTQTFSPYGFRPGSFHPCYGMAETTLLVTSVRKAEVPTIKRVDAKALEENRVVNHDMMGGIHEVSPQERHSYRTVVSCGRSWLDQTVVIADPVSLKQCEVGQVGEIWVASDSVAQGYWNRPDATQQAFHAYLVDAGEGPFLRTGDLGFWQDGALFVTGRLKDVLIIQGRNHYPQDIEQTVEASHPALNPYGSAAFLVEIDGGNSPVETLRDRVVVACEVKRTHLRHLDVEEVIRTIRRAVLQEHDLHIYRVLLLKPGTLPKTPSGKVQRFACRTGFITGELTLINSEHLDSLQQPQPEERSQVELVESIQTWIFQWIAKQLNVPVQTTKENASFADYGLDSLQAANFVQDWHTCSGYSLNLSTLVTFPTIATLTQHLTEELTQQGKSFNPDKIHTNIQKNVPLDISPESYQFECFPEYQQLQERLNSVQSLGITNPYFQVHDAIARDQTQIQSRTLINYSTYNYLGLSGHPVVSTAAKAAIDQYGTSVSASRLVSGERLLHRGLEQELATFMGVEDCIVYVSGHATNVTTIGHLFGTQDLILYDALSHNSILQGCALSGAKALSFPHNDWQALDRLLQAHRHQYRRVLIALEGIYSMDGDVPDLPRFIELKKRHKALLMVDEAHSLGVLGQQGCGIGEFFGVQRSDVDLWMGTLSKAFASCGGYIAGSQALVTYLKYTAPGFVYSVGLSPANTAAALAALRLLKIEPMRVQTLHQRSQYFLERAQAQGWNTGTSQNSPIIPIILGNSLTCIQVSQILFKAGINVQPMIYPAVANDAARLRFFISCLHTPEQIDVTIAALVEALTQVSIKVTGDAEL